MKKRIYNHVKTLVNSREVNDLQSLEKASENFEKLVKTGLTSKRGYNLMTSHEVHNQIMYCNQGSWNQ